MNVKICGIRRLDHAMVASQAGASMLGFVFAPSRRRIAPEEARDIICEVRARLAESGGRSVNAVGVFANEDVVTMNRIAHLSGLDYVQLSGDEPEEIAAALDVPVIDVVHVRKGMPADEVARRVGTTPAELVLLDTSTEAAYGGSGATFDWSVAESIERPFMLAGGLHEGNVVEAIKQVRPIGVDVSSGVETDGVKDPKKIERFVTAALEAAKSV